jgi:hypothetical protein
VLCIKDVSDFFDAAQSKKVRAQMAGAAVCEKISQEKSDYLLHNDDRVAHRSSGRIALLP